MAIDGTKIIDGDLAHDIDSEFMDLYDSGKSIDAIKSKIEEWRANVFDDVEKEIFITTYALDLWTIGALTEDILNEAKETIAKGAGVSMWREESGEKDAEARKKELNDLIAKISVSNERPQARKKRKKIEDFIFQVDDVLTFKADDGFYYATILVKILQHKGICSYNFAPTAYKSTQKPTLQDILNSEVIGSKTPTGTGFFVFGVEHVGIDHKELVKFSDKFEVLGKIQINPAFKEIGLYGGATNFENFTERYKTQEKHLTIPVFKAEKVSVKKLIQNENFSSGLNGGKKFNKILKTIIILVCLLFGYVFLHGLASFDDDKIWGDKINGVYDISSQQGDAYKQLELMASDSKSAHFYMYASSGSPTYNQGEIYGELKLKSEDDTNLIYGYTNNDLKCSFTVTVASKIQAVVSSLENKGQCGFGNGLTVDGTYSKKAGQSVGEVELMDGKKLWLGSLKTE